jgi:choline dehydrogenase-like flavoprotein
MLSGIGPKDHLQELGIPVKADLPVGQNFRDHFLVFLGPFNVEKGNSLMADRDFTPQFLHSYFHGGLSPFSTLGAGAGALFSSSIKNDPSYPDIYLTYLANGNFKGYAAGFEAGNGIKPGIFQEYMKADEGKDSFMTLVVLATPKSYGEIKLASADPMEHPLIDPNYLSHPDDIKVFVEGMQKAKRMITKSKAFASIGTKFTKSLLPGCEQYQSNASDEYLECYARHLSGCMWHYSGTCKMGKGHEDPTAVVDSQLRVLKTTGLRVVDASIMPQVTTTNTNAPTIMIAEKGSEMILKFWESKNP